MCNIEADVPIVILAQGCHTWNLNWPIRIQQVTRKALKSGQLFSQEMVSNIHGKEFIIPKTLPDCKKWNILKHFEPPSFYFGINVARLTVLLVLLEPFYLDSYIVETEGSFTAGERTYLIAELLHAEVARAEPHNRRESFEDKCYQPSAFLFGCPTDRY